MRAYSLTLYVYALVYLCIKSLHLGSGTRPDDKTCSCGAGGREFVLALVCGLIV